MSARVVSSIVGGVAMAAVLSVAAIVVWSVRSQPSDPVASAPLPQGAVLGDLTGYVGRVDRKARTVEVAEDRQGLRPVTMAVTDDTSISVRGKQGGLGDLTKDLPVRAFYEVRNDVKYLTSIQAVTTDVQAKTSPVRAETRPPVQAKPPTETRPEAPAAVASAPAATRQSPAPAPVAAAAPPPPLVPPRAPESRSEATSAPVQTVSAARQDPDAGDGTAAIDWLLKTSRPR